MLVSVTRVVSDVMAVVGTTTVISDGSTSVKVEVARESSSTVEVVSVVDATTVGRMVCVTVRVEVELASATDDESSLVVVVLSVVCRVVVTPETLPMLLNAV